MGVCTWTRWGDEADELSFQVVQFCDEDDAVEDADAGMRRRISASS